MGFRVQGLHFLPASLQKWLPVQHSLSATSAAVKKETEAKRRRKIRGYKQIKRDKQIYGDTWKEGEGSRKKTAKAKA